MILIQDSTNFYSLSHSYTVKQGDTLYKIANFYNTSINRKLSSLRGFYKYLVNENGEKFELTVGPRANGSGHISPDSDIYEFNGMFDLTKSDMTDTITLYVDHKGNKAEIVLEKVEE